MVLKYSTLVNILATTGDIVGVSLCRVKLLQSHYFKHTTSSSATEGLFQCPAYLEIYRARRTSFGEISRLHMSRLRGLKIPTMLCARTNFPKSVAEDVRRGLSYDAHLHTCSPVPLFVFRMPGSILDSLLKQDARQTCATKQAYSRLRNTNSLHISTDNILTIATNCKTLWPTFKLLHLCVGKLNGH